MNILGGGGKSQGGGLDVGGLIGGILGGGGKKGILFNVVCTLFLYS